MRIWPLEHTTLFVFYVLIKSIKINLFYAFSIIGIKKLWVNWGVWFIVSILFLICKLSTAVLPACNLPIISIVCSLNFVWIAFACLQILIKWFRQWYFIKRLSCSSTKITRAGLVLLTHLLECSKQNVLNYLFIMYKFTICNYC